MEKKIKYTHEAIEAEIIRDFLPPPEVIALQKDSVKVTLTLSKKSVDFFKLEASKHHTQYRRMIQKLIDSYVDTYAESGSPRSKPATRKRVAG